MISEAKNIEFHLIMGYTDLHLKFIIALASAMRSPQMALPTSFYSETTADNTVKQNGQPEHAVWAVPVTTLTAANLVAQTANITALRTAVAAICIGEVVQYAITQNRTEFPDVPATSVLAQRENKLLLRYHGTTLNKKFRVSIPCFDLTTLPTHSEFLDLTVNPGLALKTAFDAVVVSPDDAAENVSLDSAQFVGRNT